ncbi:PRP40 pre-mRNA processing factor 40 [Kappamyces sp. JEL0829]|nr:PRP40 pre-mRNA processing factor 40 [Kappamyces sp. JEL0829]
MYRALKSVNERKETFQSYVNERAAKDKEIKEQKYNSDLLLLHRLFKGVNVTGSTTYKDMLLLLESHPEFDESDEENRKKIFEAYVEELRTKEKEEERERRKQQLAHFRKLLDSFGLTPGSTWRETHSLLEEHFEGPELKGMDRMDAIVAFEDYIATMDSSLRQARSAKFRAMKRQERKDREGFCELLRELKSSGVLHMLCKWKDIYPSIKDDPRYLAMLGTSGSSALELYRDEIMDLEDAYLPSRRIVVDAVRGSKFDVKPSTKFSDFMSYFKRDFHNLSIDHIKCAFNELVYKAESRAREEKRYQEKKLRRNMDDFKSLLKHLSPPLTLDMKWREVRPLVVKESAYIALDEEQRIEVFDKVMKRLQEKKEERKRQRSKSPTSSKDVSDDESRKKKKRDTQSEEEEGELVE